MARPTIMVGEHAYDDRDQLELFELYHTARIALDNPTRYERMQYAARWYNKRHPERTATGAYKALERSM